MNLFIGKVLKAFFVVLVVAGLAVKIAALVLESGDDYRPAKPDTYEYSFR
jgi:hypothetical protein